MKLQTLIFMRHGETEHNKNKILSGQSDGPLSEHGKKQAEKTADYLRRFEIEHVYASSKTRARQTSSLICEKLGIGSSETSELVERNFGKFEGMSREELLETRERAGLTNFDPSQHWPNVPGVESDQEIYDRTRKFLTKVEGYHSTVLIVTHAGVMKSFIHKELGILETGRPYFKFPNASFCVLQRTTDKFEIHELNVSGYIEAG